jgi:uncharacterized protein (TIGR02172 family)
MENSKTLRKISLEGCELIGRGAIGSVYRLDDENIVKVYEKDVPFEVIDRERIAARAAFVAGLPCAITYDTVDVDGKIGIVYEMFKADTLASVIMKNPEKIALYAADVADIARSMHTAEAVGVDSVKKLWLDWCEGIRSKISDDEFESAKAVINAVPDASTFVHGDLHPKNIMVVPETGEYLLIDMGDVGYGSPVFDLAVIFTCLNMSAKFMPPERVMQAYGMTKEICSEYYNAFKDSYAPGDTALWEQVEKLAQVRQTLWRAMHGG